MDDENNQKKYKDTDNLIQADIYKDEKLLVSGYLWSKKNGNLELKGNIFPLLDPGEKLKIIVHYENGRTEVFLTYVFLSQKNYMRLIVISKSIESDLRSYYRVDTEIPMDIFYQLIKDVPVAVDKPIKSTVLDISLGGFLLGCNRDLPVGNQYKADLILKDTIINISFDIVRKASSLKFTNQYGCIFKNNSRKNDQELCKYIFYREKLKRIALNNII